jgi:hypothetical protein
MSKVLIALGDAKISNYQFTRINIQEVLDISKPNMVVHIFKIFFLSQTKMDHN